MASEIIGRMCCPECGFHAAHVKIKTDKEGAHPYRHCPDCGAQYFTRTKTQADNLRKSMRPEGQQIQADEVPKLEQALLDPPPAEQKFKMVLGVKVPL